MSYGFNHYNRSWHGDLGPGKRPDQLPKPDRSSELLTAVEAGLVLGCSGDHVRVLIRRGKLRSEFTKGKHFVRRGDVERLRGEL
jgi:hypothetical protein